MATVTIPRSPVDGGGPARLHVRDLGATMGGRMTAHGLWLLAAAGAGAGTGIETQWTGGLAAAAAVVIASFPVRGTLERLMPRLRSGRTR